jgi:hypothetical protein
MAGSPQKFDFCNDNPGFRASAGQDRLSAVETVKIDTLETGFVKRRIRLIMESGIRKVLEVRDDDQ